jgi:hypothetical protein
MKLFAKIIVALMLLFGLIGWICSCSGCASVDVITPEVEFHSVTVLKDIRIDPNGVCSTTSTATESIFTGLFGFLAGLWL